MRFRDSSTPPPYFNKADQFRMLRMVGLLALVMFAMKLAADPGMWRCLFSGAPQKPAQTQKRPAGKEKDTGRRLKLDEDSPLAQDAFRSRKSDSPKPAIAEASPNRRAATSTNEAARKKNVGDVAVEIDPEILAQVVDNKVGLRREEAHAFYTVIAKARDVSEPLLEKAARQVDYTVLLADAEQYRGLPIAIEGTIRRLNKIPVPDEDMREEFGLDQFYEAWMFTAGSGTHPYRVISTSLPADIPMGDEIEVPTKFTGYFFKPQWYESLDGLKKAPLLIGKTIQRMRPAAAASESANDLGLAPYVIGLAVLVALGLGLMIWRFNASDKKFGHQHIDHFTAATPAAIQELQNLETSDPADLFRQMQADALAEDVQESDNS